MSLDIIIQECIKGDARAQRKLFEIFSPKMMTVCRRYMNNVMEAEDVFQVAFVKVFDNLNKYQNVGSFEGWVRRIFVNCCLDQIRKNKNTKYDVDIDDLAYKIGESDYTLEKLAAEDLLKLIQDMPDGYRVVFNQFAIEGYSHKEIAKRMGITESTSKSQFKRARGYLIKCLEKLEHEGG